MVDQTSGAIRGDYRRVSRPILDLPRPYSVETRDEPKGSVLRFAPGVLGFYLSGLADASHPADRWPRPRGARGTARSGGVADVAGDARGGAGIRAGCADAREQFRRVQRAANTPRADARTSSRWARPMAPHARIVAYRPGAEAGPPGTFFLETARRAAEAGFAVTRSELPFAVGTRFGPAEAADVSMSSGGEPQSCLAFRLALETADLRISGWLCGGGARRPDRTQLACFIDRLDLAPGNLRHAAARRFAGKSSACPPARPAATRGRFG